MQHIAILLPLLLTSHALAAPANDWIDAIEAGKKAFEAKQLDDAQKHFEKAVKIAETFGGKDVRLAGALDHLGTVHSMKRQYDKAEPLFKRAIAVIENAYGKGHPDLLMTLQSLGTLYRTTSKLDDAGKVYEQIVVICEAAYGKDDERVATAVNNAAALEGMRGRFDKAAPLLERALAIRLVKLGESHLLVATTHTDLANTYFRLGRLDEAAAHYQKALTIIEAQQKDRPPHVEALNKLAQLHEARKKPVEAVPPYEQALAILEKGLGKDHAQVGTALYRLAGAQTAALDFAPAEANFKRSLAIAEKHAGGKDDEEVGKVTFSLARLYFEQKKYREAEPHCKRSINAFVKTVGPKHPFYALAVLNYAAVLEGMGKHAEAKKLKDAVQALQEQLKQEQQEKK